MVTTQQQCHNTVSSEATFSLWLLWQRVAMDISCDTQNMESIEYLKWIILACAECPVFVSLVVLSPVYVVPNLLMSFFNKSIWYFVSTRVRAWRYTTFSIWCRNSWHWMSKNELYIIANLFAYVKCSARMVIARKSWAPNPCKYVICSTRFVVK